jgi:hypothetical protein
MNACQTELRLSAKNDVVSHDDYAAFLAQYCQSNPGWACSYDTSFFWRLDPRLQRAFMSDSCPGDAFHQEECLEYFAEHPEKHLGYSGEIEKLCSSVKELLVPTGLVQETAAFSNEDSSFENGTRSQELGQSQAHAADEYTGMDRGSKRSGKRGKGNENYFSDVDDEEDEEFEEGEEMVNDKGKKGRQGFGKKDGGGEEDNELLGEGQSEEDREGHQSAGNSSSTFAGETNDAFATGDQDILASVDGSDSEGSLQVEISSNATVPSMGLDEENSNELITEQPNKLNQEPQDAHEGVKHNGHSQPAPPQSKSEDSLGSSQYDENMATSDKDKDKIRNFVLAITGSFAFILILGVTHGSRIRLHQRNKDAPSRHYECFAEDEVLSLPSGESGLFQSSNGSTLEAALTFIDSRTKKELVLTSKQRAGIASHFSRLIHLVKRDTTAASDFDSVHARCEDLSLEALNDESPIFDSPKLTEEAMVDEEGWRKRLEIGGFTHDIRGCGLFGAGKSSNRILRQIEESPCESEISAEESSISVYTESSCNDVVSEERLEQLKEFDDSLTTGLSKLAGQMSKLVANDCTSLDVSAARSLRDCFESRAGNEFVYRGGAGSSGADSSTASDIESTCSSTTENMQADATE